MVSTCILSKASKEGKSCNAILYNILQPKLVVVLQGITHVEVKYYRISRQGMMSLIIIITINYQTINFLLKAKISYL